jgi:hypothetical protein
MYRSLLRTISIVLLLTLGIASCSILGHEEKPPATPVKLLHTGTMDLTAGIALNALVKTPPGFAPIAGQPPLWLQGGKEIALPGTLDGRTQVLGFSSGGYKKMRLVAADGGPGASHGKIVGLAASPDGMTLAVAVAEPGRIEIVLRYVISNGESSVASFDGSFHAVSLNWMAPHTLAVGLAGEPTAASADSGSMRPGAPNAGGSPAQTGGLFLIHVVGAVTVEQIKLACQVSMLVFSPDMRFAVGEGDAQTPPSLFDSRNGDCRQVTLEEPIRVLGWAPQDAAFLYSAPPGRARGPGVYRYAIATGTTELIAVSSGAAAYTGAGTIMALGNRALTAQTAMSAPDRRVTAEIASFDPKEKQSLVNTLGTPTTPSMMMASTMTYSHGFAELALQLYVAGPDGAIREIVTYSIIDRKAFVLASGPFRGTAVIGWSPHANQLVIFDGDGTSGALAVITPSR